MSALDNVAGADRGLLSHRRHFTVNHPFPLASLPRIILQLPSESTTQSRLLGRTSVPVARLTFSRCQDCEQRPAIFARHPLHATISLYVPLHDLFAIFERL